MNFYNSLLIGYLNRVINYLYSIGINKESFDTNSIDREELSNAINEDQHVRGYYFYKQILENRFLMDVENIGLVEFELYSISIEDKIVQCTDLLKILENNPSDFVDILETFDEKCKYISYLIDNQNLMYYKTGQKIPKSNNLIKQLEDFEYWTTNAISFLSNWTRQLAEFMKTNGEQNAENKVFELFEKMNNIVSHFDDEDFENPEFNLFVIIEKLNLYHSSSVNKELVNYRNLIIRSRFKGNGDAIPLETSLLVYYSKITDQLNEHELNLFNENIIRQYNDTLTYLILLQEECKKLSDYIFDEDFEEPDECKDSFRWVVRKIGTLSNNDLKTAFEEKFNPLLKVIGSDKNAPIKNKRDNINKNSDMNEIEKKFKDVTQSTNILTKEDEQLLELKEMFQSNILILFQFTYTVVFVRALFRDGNRGKAANLESLNSRFSILFEMTGENFFKITNENKGIIEQAIILLTPEKLRGFFFWASSKVNEMVADVKNQFNLTDFEMDAELDKELENTFYNYYDITENKLIPLSSDTFYENFKVGAIFFAEIFLKNIEYLKEYVYPNFSSDKELAVSLESNPNYEKKELEDSKERFLNIGNKGKKGDLAHLVNVIDLIFKNISSSYSKEEIAKLAYYAIYGEIPQNRDHAYLHKKITGTNNNDPANSDSAESGTEKKVKEFLRNLNIELKTQK